MTLHYRETDPISGRWTANTSGVKLSSFQGDENIWTLDLRITATQAMITASRGIVSITSSLGELTFHMSDSTTEGPIAIPVLAFHGRGAWAPSTAYSLNDTFYINGAAYLVEFPHTSALTFSAGANDGMGHDYYSVMMPNPGNALATGGSAGMVYTKTSSADFAANWSFASAINVTFSPSTASGLVSTNVAAALEELETLIGTGPAGFLPLSGGTLTGVLTLSADPASALQPATKQYVDGIALNLGTRGRVRAATTANVNLASALANGSTVDTSVTLVTGDLVLVRSQSTPAQNGIYLVPASGAANRSTEFAAYNDYPGSLIAVEEGTSNSDTIWLCTSNTGGTLGTTAISFNQSSASGALLSSNNLSDVGNAATARTNLGLGTSATHASGDFALTANNLSDLANAASARTNLGLGTSSTHAAGDFMLSANNLADLASAATARTNLGLGTAATSAATAFQTADAQLSSLIRQNSQSAAYTTVLTDGGKHILHPSADTATRTFTIDSNANVAYPIGTAITFVNQNGGGAITVAITSDTMRLAGAGSTGSRTLAANGIATALKITSTEWIISGTGLT
jgi:hypothetical protein